jgi:molybdopterin molybdotransferase
VVIGLPGNPVSAFVTATLFALPLVRHLSGARTAVPERIAATCSAALPATGSRTDFVRARWVAGALVPLPSGDSGVLSGLAAADALIVRPAGSTALAAGAQVEAIRLD